jgi:endoglucanase
VSTTLITDPSKLAHEAHRRLARTVNIGPDFGARLERNWTISIERAHLEACAQAGFTAIRLLVYLCAHQSSSGLDPVMLAQLERIVDDATDLGLAVVISNHRDPQLLHDPDTHLPPTVAMVTHLSAAFEGRGSELVIEPLSEPEQALDAIWNQTATELIGAVRRRDHRRTVLIGPRTMNNARFLGELDLPTEERNLIVGIHHYWPITFTMQGETFLGEDHIFGNPQEWIGTTWDQTPHQEAELRTGFDQVAAWSAETRYPLFLGEFGTTCNADLASRARWTRFNRRLAEHRGIPWAIWSFGPVFGIYDVDTGTFIPELLAALMD